MKYKTTALALTCASLFLCTTAQAESDAGRMHVQISNNTMTMCRLTSQTLLHGTLDNAPPQTIMANDSKAFDMHQALMGPDLILSYNCDGRNIRFEVQQDSSIFYGQEPKINIIESSGYIVQFSSQSSSIFWNSPGIINISIFSR